MRIEGRLIKQGKFWAAEVPALVLFTQGRSRKEAFEMVKDAVEGLVDSDGFEAEVIPASGEAFYVRGSDYRALISTVLKQMRANCGLSVRDVAHRLGSTSPTAYARYERGNVHLSMEKLEEIVHAIDEGVEPVLSFARKRA